MLKQTVVKLVCYKHAAQNRQPRTVRNVLRVVQRRHWAWNVIAFLSFGVACLPWSAFSTNPAVYAADTVPKTMNFQGRLADSTNAPLADGLYNMTFRLYDATANGTLKWSEVREVGTRVQVTNGLFSTQLGLATALSPSIFASGNLYFEVEMPSAATATCATASCASYSLGPLSPRSVVSTSAYAFNAEHIDGVDGASLAQLGANNTFSGSNTFSGTNSFTGASNSFTSSVSLNGGATFGGTTTFNAAASSTNTVNIRTTSNSPTAFAVQNSSSKNILVADTSGSKITIGDSTDTSATFLVLDSYTGATDPAGTNGALYYNTTMGKMRCYEGAWKNCVSDGPKTEIFTDTTTLPAFTATDTTELFNDATPPSIVTSSTASTVMVALHIRGTSNSTTAAVRAARVIYTTNGTDPSCSTSAQAGGPFVSSQTTVKTVPYNIVGTFIHSPAVAGTIKYSVCTSASTVASSDTPTQISVTLVELGP